MRLVLYSDNETRFTSLGLGVLTEAVDDEVHEVINGAFDLTFRYPVTGPRAEQLQRRNIVTARPNALTDIQPFRIVRVNRRSPGWITVTARHISRDMRGIVLREDQLWGPAGMYGSKPLTINDCPFTFTADFTDDYRYDGSKARNLWESLGTGKGMLVDLHGGEFEFDRFAVNYRARRGEDRGVAILYGKNLRSLEAETASEIRYNGIYWFSTDAYGNLMPGQTMMVSGYVEGQEQRLKVVDLCGVENSYTAALDAVAELEAQEQADNSIKVDFELLSRTEEYRGRALPDGIALGDTIHVGHPGLGVQESIRVMEIRYQPTTGKYKTITLGTPRGNILRTMRRIL